jgi:hypothetical protein
MENTTPGAIVPAMRKSQDTTPARRHTDMSRHTSPQPSPEGNLAAISDLSSLAAALCFPGCATRLHATAIPPCLIICHPYVPGPQRITAEGDFFCWAHPAGLTPFSLRRGRIGLAAGAASVLLSYLIIEHAGQQREDAR